MTTPGSTPGGATPDVGGGRGGNTPSTPGTPGGVTRGGVTRGGLTPGGNTPGGNAPGGTPGLNTGNFTAPGDITGLGFRGSFGGGGTPGGGTPGGGGGGGFLGGGTPGNFTGLGTGGAGGYGVYGAGAPGSLGNLASQAFGGAGAGLGGMPGDLTGLGFGSTGTSGNFGISPALAGSTGIPALQSSIDLNQPSPITAGANNQNQNQQTDQSTGTQSGAGPSILDQLYSMLGGLNPISSAGAAPAATSQNTLTQGDVQSAPFLGPWTGTDTGQGKQFGAPYTPEPTGARVTEGTWAGNDPQAGGEAAPLGGAQPPAQTGTGWFTPDRSGNLGGEAAPLGGASPYGAEYGPFAGGAGPGSITPIPGGLDYSQPAPNAPSDSNETVSDTFASRFGSFQPPSSGGPVSTTGDITGLGYGPQSQNNISTAVETAPVGSDFSPNALNAPPGSFQFSGSFGPDNRFTVPGTTAATTTPPVSGSPEDSDLADPSQTDPNQTVQQTLADLTTNTPTPRPDPRNLLSTPIGSGVGNIMSNLPADTSGIPLPTADPRNAPTTFADRFSPFDTSNVPIPRAGPGAPVQTGGGGSAPGSTSVPGTAPGAPAQTGGVAPQSAPGATPGGVGPNDMGAVGGGGDQQQRGQFTQGRRSPVHNAIANIFGGGQLGDTVASLMLQLGIPAALIFAASRGGGGGGQLGMLGGRAAMGGAGRVGGFAPQFGRQLFPGALSGTGIPNWLIPGVAGAMVGQRLDQPQQSQTQDHPPVMPGTPPGPQAPQTPAADSPFVQRGFTTPRGGNMPLPRPAFAFAPQTSAQPNGAGSPAESFIQQRGGHTAGAGAPPLDPEFASRVQRAAQAYEAETGRPASFGETGRSHEKQAEYYDEFRRTGQGRAAPPYSSRHEKGLAIDITESNFQNWMHRNAWKFGLEGLRPELNDPNHFQMTDPVLAGIRQRQASMQ